MRPQKRRREIPTDIIELYQSHKQTVYRLALSYLHSTADAEDLCQDVFLRCLEHITELQPGKEKAWLCTVTANLCKNRLRSAAYRLEEELSDNIPFETGTQRVLFAAVMSLNAKERAAVYLYYYEGYATKEIAKILSISQTAVTTRLGRARRQLRSRLEAEL